tara:strand:+ start:1462 stop:2184 length:723 start_codon:yes stop_codon:yes gene_type:complete
MYNPNNVIIGGAIIFLVAYAFFILRRMYKRRISVLEQTNLELTNALKEITDMEQDHMEQAHMEQDNGIENISADLFRQNGEAFTKARESNVIFEVMNHSQKIPTNSVEIESIQEIPNTVPQNVETIPENIVIESRSGNYTVETIPETVETNPQILETIPETVETNPQILETIPETVETIAETVETISDIPNNNTENKLGISKDDINSMTVAQLKEKLTEIGTPIVKGMKKKELRAILLAL